MTQNAHRLIKAAAATLAGLAFSLGFNGPAQAHERDFPFTTEWLQPAKNEKEIELHSRYRERDRSFQQQIEFEYGITERFATAQYIVFNKDSEHNSLRYEAWKLEARYQFGEYAANRVLPGLYLEYEQPREGKGEIEGKLILSSYDRKGGNLSLNLIAERELESGAEWETEYSLGYARSIGTGAARPRLGLEWIHNLESGRINAGPTIAFSPVEKIWLTAGLALPVNRREGNGTEVRLLIEHEWF